VFTCIYIYLHLFTCIYIYLHVFTSIYIYLHVFTRIYISPSTHNFRLFRLWTYSLQRRWLEILRECLSWMRRVQQRKVIDVIWDRATLEQRSKQPTRLIKFRLLIFFKSALHVSGDTLAHPQEHFLTVYTALVQCTDIATDLNRSEKASHWISIS